MTVSDTSRKTALVAGGRGGIGGAIACSLGRAGCNVVTLDISKVADAAADPHTIHLETDLTSRAQVQEAVRRSLDAFGRIDILVNAAGVTSFGSAATLDEAEWDRVLNINLKAVFLTCQAVIPVMKAARQGRIINIGSILAKNGGNARPWIDPAEQDVASNVAYGASKAGVHTLTFYLARELASHGVTVNAVAPGPIASAMTRNFPDRLKALIPLGRMGTTEDVAAVVAFLASDAARYITGEIIDVNGGAWSD
jgi:3-oxoacyl-[acyl-carrier protein] reductase